MKIYSYHPEYKTYLGSSDADPSPLEPGVFLVPAHVTEIEPPQCLDCEILVFNGISWDIIENCCGTYYSIPYGQSIEHNNPLEPPENSTKEKPPEVPEGFYLEWNDQWEIKKIPVPEPLTAEKKLQQAGLTVEELKELLGL